MHVMTRKKRGCEFEMEQDVAAADAEILMKMEFMWVTLFPRRSNPESPTDAIYSHPWRVQRGCQRLWGGLMSHGESQKSEKPQLGDWSRRMETGGVGGPGRNVSTALLSPRGRRRKEEFPPGKRSRHTTYAPCFSKKCNSLKNFPSLLYYLP